MPRPIRRVVTGHTPDGRATIISDGPAPQVSAGPDPEGGSTVLWVTQRAPASNAGNDDAAPAGPRIPVPPPSPGGTVFRVVDFLPASRASAPASNLPGVHHTADRSARHPGFHQTDSIDYAIVLEGEIWALLDDAETLLHTGDVLIQRGTFHAWDNRSEQVCRVAFVLVDAEPDNPQLSHPQ
jgi:quercetin dioxygenase-like cupin family protein